MKNNNITPLTDDEILLLNMFRLLSEEEQKELYKFAEQFSQE